MAKIKLSDIKLDDRNHNQHSQHGMGLLAKSVEQNGVIESVTISSDNVAITGNARTETFVDKGFEDAILVETDGTKPIVIRRTDIKSKTKQFYNAALAANGVAKQNIVVDVKEVKAICEEFDIVPEAVGLDISIENTEVVDEDPDNDYFGRYPLAIILTKKDFQTWQDFKKNYTLRNDTQAFLKLMGDNLVKL